MQDVLLQYGISGVGLIALGWFIMHREKEHKKEKEEHRNDREAWRKDTLEKFGEITKAMQETHRETRLEMEQAHKETLQVIKENTQETRGTSNVLTELKILIQSINRK